MNAKHFDTETLVQGPKVEGEWECLKHNQFQYHRLHQSVNMGPKKTCSNRVPDMTCFVAKHLKFDSCVKQTVAPDQRVPLVSLFHFSQLAGIFLT